MRSATIVRCFSKTHPSSTICLFREKPRSTSACPWITHNAAFTTTMRFAYFGLPSPSLRVDTRAQYLSTGTTPSSWVTAQSIEIISICLIQPPFSRQSQENGDQMPNEALTQPAHESFGWFQHCPSLMALGTEHWIRIHSSMATSAADTWMSFWRIVSYSEVKPVEDCCLSSDFSTQQVCAHQTHRLVQDDCQVEQTVAEHHSCPWVHLLWQITEAADAEFVQALQKEDESRQILTEI